MVSQRASASPLPPVRGLWPQAGGPRICAAPWRPRCRRSVPRQHAARNTWLQGRVVPCQRGHGPQQAQGRRGVRAGRLRTLVGVAIRPLQHVFVAVAAFPLLPLRLLGRRLLPRCRRLAQRQVAHLHHREVVLLGAAGLRGREGASPASTHVRQGVAAQGPACRARAQTCCGLRQVRNSSHNACHSRQHAPPSDFGGHGCLPKGLAPRLLPQCAGSASAATKPGPGCTAPACRAHLRARHHEEGVGEGGAGRPQMITQQVK